MRHRLLIAALVTASSLLSANVSHATDPSAKCRAGKLKEAGKYSYCRLKAEATALQRGTTPDFTRCDLKFADKFNGLETRAGAGVCPTEGDATTIQQQVTNDSSDLRIMLEGGRQVGGAWWFLGGPGESCDTVCSSLGFQYDPATDTYAGYSGDLAHCAAVTEALPQPPAGPCATTWAEPFNWNWTIGLGCNWSPSDMCSYNGTYVWLASRAIGVPTTSDASLDSVLRVCACQR
jgi:hypothetical protein